MRSAKLVVRIPRRCRLGIFSTRKSSRLSRPGAYAGPVIRKVNGSILLGILGHDAVWNLSRRATLACRPAWRFPILPPRLLQLTCAAPRTWAAGDHLRILFVTFSTTSEHSLAFSEQAGFVKTGKYRDGPRAARRCRRTVFGSLTGTSTVTSYVERRGVAVGARTGLSNVWSRPCFLQLHFSLPWWRSTAFANPAPALILVGALMNAVHRQGKMGRNTRHVSGIVTMVRRS